MPKSKKMSPGRRQYLDTKRQYPDALLLFRMGDFYETFDEDARTMARVLDIALTQRDVGGGEKSLLAGIPYHSLEAYLGTLVKTGLRIAICEQTSDPAQSKGIVDRAVVRVVTPGTVLEPGLLDEGKNNYLAAAIAEGQTAGLAYVDVTTSEFKATQVSVSELLDELKRLDPSEILASPLARSLVEEDESSEWLVRDLSPGTGDPAYAEETLRRHFGVASLAPFGLDDRPLATIAAASILDYLSASQVGSLPQITSISTLGRAEYMVLDPRALRDLEIAEPGSSARQGKRAGATLIGELDRTRTPMGRRMLRSWLLRPLLDAAEIRSRHDRVDGFRSAPVVRQNVRDALSDIGDLERLTNRVRTFSANPRDVLAISRGLGQAPAIVAQLSEIGVDAGDLVSTEKSLAEVTGLVGNALADEPSMTPGDGSTIREGWNAELDGIRALATDTRSTLAAVETEIQETTGVKSAKVGYNKVFGYYIEISRANLEKVPEEFERRQTLVNAERFITPRLKELEARIFTARERISELERELFRRVLGDIMARGEQIMRAARSLAEVDVLSALGEIAATRDYVRPEINDGDALNIIGGRHPVVERTAGAGKFVPNDVNLSSSGQQLAIITGPNMAGKSTYIRQAGLLVLMAQAGSFVPATSAEIGVTDRIFTRCNLADDIAGGRSTFLVEMEETAAILRQATRKSLVILDEIGRGTSTFDGMAIARAVAEHIHSSPALGCKTLFATHYHEMTELADLLPRAVNYQVSVADEDGEIVFLHRIVEGGADRSYGVHVGRIAGLPAPVISRAWELLDQLESSRPQRVNGKVHGMQLQLTEPDDALRGTLADLNIDEMTPVQAIIKLYELRQEALRERG